MSTSDAENSAAGSLHRRMPPVVRLSPQFVNRICGSISQGSPEKKAAGLLFGVARSGLVVVQAFKSFCVVDSQDTDGIEAHSLQGLFRDSVRRAQSDPEVSALVLIGWYWIRQSGGLNAADLDFHRSNFLGVNDLAIILTRQNSDNVVLEVYTRGNGEALSADDYHWGAIRLTLKLPLIGPIEIPLRAANGNEKQSSGDLQPTVRQAAKAEDKPTSVLQKKIHASIANRLRQQQTQATEVDGESSIEPMELARLHVGTVPAVPALWNAPAAPRRVPWIPSAVICAVAAAGTFGFFVLRDVPADSAPPFLRPFLINTGLVLRAEGQGDRVLLSWNRRNPVVRSATAGILHIDDGSQHRDVRLDADQVKNGLVLYRPGSNDVTFRLEIHGQETDSIGETVRVLDGTQNSLEDLKEASLPGPSDPMPFRAKTAPAAERTRPINNSDSNSDLSAPLAEHANSYARHPPSAGAPVNRTSPLEHPLEDANAVSLANADFLKAVQAPVPKTAFPAGFMPPQPTRQVLPDTKLLPPPALQTVDQVEVMVEIDNNGLVRSAQLINRKNRIDRDVSAAAISAAKQWVFEPATFHGQRVASYHTIIFQFQHQSQ